MGGEAWLTDIKNAKKSCVVQNKTKKVHYLFGDNREMVEEYNMETDVVTRRAWKIKTELGSDGVWDVELGDPEPKALNTDSAMIAENSNQPFLTRRLTKRNLEWRIRNLPYPIEVYSVTADKDNNCIVVRTSNKKYFKKLVVPELVRVDLLPEQSNIEFTHKYNTLIITYKKPTEVVKLENAVLTEIKQLKPLPMSENPDNCKPS